MDLVIMFLDIDLVINSQEVLQVNIQYTLNIKCNYFFN